MIGPRVGPPVMHKDTNVIAFPRVAGVNTSPSAAGTLLMGADAKIPPTKRVSKMDAADVLVAVPTLKRARTNMAGSMPARRP